MKKSIKFPFLLLLTVKIHGAVFLKTLTYGRFSRRKGLPSGLLISKYYT
ncbi:MAG: hypothetical protein ACJAUL_003667 [Paraglaciecola sp.]|jgi:hypothetical protein